MIRKLALLLLALPVAFGLHAVTRSKRMQRALSNTSQFEPINSARAQNKRLLVSIEPPGCQWAQHAAQEIGQVQAKFVDRYVFMQLQVGTVATNGTDPFDYLSSKCEAGLCLFDPAGGAVKALPELIAAADLERELETFAR